MKNLISILSFLLITSATLGQNPLSIFDNLVGKTWKAEGAWESGQKFSQEVTAQYTLDSTLVMMKSKGFTNQEQTTYGLRNYGFRQYDSNTKSVHFWEFDIFGNLTKGTVFNDKKNIYYQYKYGESQVTDMWEFVNDSTYNFKVGNYVDGTWKQTYLSTQFHTQPENLASSIFRNLKHKLTGQWTSKAWDGILNENWFVDNDGNLTQRARYFEDDKLLYEATNKIELIENELILITVIKNNNPKIFKATKYDKNQLVFENTDYKNPSKVIYKFTSNNDQFEREISGTENNKPSNYTFVFKKMNE